MAGDLLLLTGRNKLALAYGEKVVPWLTLGVYGDSSLVALTDSADFSGTG